MVARQPLSKVKETTDSSTNVLSDCMVPPSNFGSEPWHTDSAVWRSYVSATAQRAQDLLPAAPVHFLPQPRLLQANG